MGKNILDRNGHLNDNSTSPVYSELRRSQDKGPLVLKPGASRDERSTSMRCRRKGGVGPAGEQAPRQNH